MPALGRSGRLLPGGNGIAAIFRECTLATSSETYRYLPSGAHCGMQYPEQSRFGSPPSIGIAISAIVLGAPLIGTVTAAQRPSGETPMKLLIGYGTTLVRAEPSRLMRYR